MAIQLSDRFTYRRLLRFAFPSILTMIFTSIYGVVDGYFVSNYTGKTAFAAINLDWPMLMILGGFGFIVGTGGSALIGKTLGRGNRTRANQLFSMLIYIAIAVGLVLAAFGAAVMPQVARLLGADENMLADCVEYGRISMIGVPAVILQYAFQSYFVLAEKPKLGLYTTLAAGIANMVMDYVLVGLFGLGVAGAACATVINEVIGGVIPLCYFAHKNTSLLKLGPWFFDAGALWKTMSNGASEFVSNISMNIVSVIYNLQLMKYAGENGVAAYGVLMYVSMIFLAIFIGYSMGTAPIVSYHYGAGNTGELQSLLRKGLTINGSLALVMLLAGELAARPLASLYVGYDDTLLALTVHAFHIFSFSFPFAALPIFGSSFFTALNDGAVSAAISFLRTMVFQIGAVLLFPLLLGVDGIWLSFVAAEFIAGAVTAAFAVIKREKYHYW